MTAFEGQLEELEDDEYFNDEFPYCHRCDNNGTILVCPDDMCRGIGECIHGDGEIICPECDSAFNL